MINAFGANENDYRVTCRFVKRELCCFSFYFGFSAVCVLGEMVGAISHTTQQKARKKPKG